MFSRYHQILSSFINYLVKWHGCVNVLNEGTHSTEAVIISRPRQFSRHFAVDIFKCIFLNENVWFSITISLKFVPKGLINNIPALVQIMARRRPSDKLLSEPIYIYIYDGRDYAQPQCNIYRPVSSPLCSVYQCLWECFWGWIKSFHINGLYRNSLRRIDKIMNTSRHKTETVQLQPH